MYSTIEFDREIRKERTKAKKGNGERTPWKSYSVYSGQSLEEIKKVAYYTTKFDNYY